MDVLWVDNLMKKRNLSTKIIEFLKSIFNKEAIGTILTIIIGIIIELLCQITVNAQGEEFDREWIERVFTDYTTYMQIINVCTMSIITWFIVGMAELINGKSHRVAKFITITTIIVVIITVLWHVIKGVFPNNVNIIYVSSVLFVVSFVLLMILFRCIEPGYSDQKNKIDDGIIAASRE